MVPGKQLWSLSREFEITPRGVLRWDDVADTTASSEVAPLFSPLPRVLLRVPPDYQGGTVGPPDPSVTSGWSPKLHGIWKCRGVLP